MPLELSVRKTADGVVVTCVGRVVFGEEAAALREQVKELMEQDPRIVLDMAGVRDVDSGGIGTLVGLYTSAVNAGGELKVAAPSPKVRQTLSITRLLGIIRAYDRVEEALAAFRTDKPKRANAS